jgi:hypothetical protein
MHHIPLLQNMLIFSAASDSKYFKIIVIIIIINIIISISIIIILLSNLEKDLIYNNHISCYHSIVFY